MTHPIKQKQHRHYEDYIRVRVARSTYDKVRRLAYQENRSIASLMNELLQLGIVEKEHIDKNYPDEE